MIDKLEGDLVPFNGHVVVDGEPAAWDGKAPAHVVVVSFESQEKAMAWKASDAFKTFDAERKQITLSDAFLVDGKPTAVLAARSPAERRYVPLNPLPIASGLSKHDKEFGGIKDICVGCY